MDIYLWKECHTCSSVLQFEVLICKLHTINGFTSSPIPMCGVPTLNHKAGNDAMEYRTLVVQRFATWPFTFLPWIQMHNHMAILSCIVWNSFDSLHYSLQSAQEKLLIVATQLLSRTKSYTFDANPVYHRNQSIWKTAAKAYQCKVLGSFLLTTQQRAIIRWTWEIPSSRAEVHTEKVPLQNPYSAGIFFDQTIQPEFQTISLPSLKLNRLAKKICSKEADSWKTYRQFWGLHCQRGQSPLDLAHIILSPSRSLSSEVWEYLHQYSITWCKLDVKMPRDLYQH